MRLTEERINHLAKEMVQALESMRVVKIERSKRPFVVTRLAKVILEDLHKEDEIEAEVRRRLRRMANPPPDSSPEWNALFRQEKEALAARRGYVL